MVADGSTGVVPSTQRLNADGSQGVLDDAWLVGACGGPVSSYVQEIDFAERDACQLSLRLRSQARFVGGAGNWGSTEGRSC